MSYDPHLDEKDGMPEQLLETIFADVYNFVVNINQVLASFSQLRLLLFKLFICASYDFMVSPTLPR